MVDSRFLITVSRPNRSNGYSMATEAGSQLTHQPPHRNRKPAGAANPGKAQDGCHRSYRAAADVAALIAVLLAFGFLLLPSLQLACRGVAGLGAVVLSELRGDDPAGALFASLLVAVAFFLLAVAAFAALRRGAALGRSCGSPNCRRLRNAAQFDVRIETEEQARSSSCPHGRDGSGRFFVELSVEHHRDLEAELRKMAPPNGRAILLFQEKCGCAVGGMVVAGPKKTRKAKR